jgi:hypothetical protein
MDLAKPREIAIDAFDLVKHRLNPTRIILPPTALAELVYISQNADTELDRRIAHAALSGLRRFGLETVPFVPLPLDAVTEIAEELESTGLVPVN